MSTNASNSYLTPSVMSGDGIMYKMTGRRRQPTNLTSMTPQSIHDHLPPRTHPTHTGYHILSAIIFLFGISAIAHFLSRRFRIRDVKSISYASYPRLLIILLFVDSWMFLFSGAILVQGAGMELNNIVCSLGMYSCIAFYASSKIFVYLYFIDKVLTGWSFLPNVNRKTSPVFLFCVGLLSLYTGVVIYLVIRKLSYFRVDGSCMIGLKSVASISLFSYDLFIALALSSLFLWPLYRSRFNNDAQLRTMAIHNFWAAAVALTTSCINIFILMLLNGRQLAWVCLASCGIDVVVNASVLFWVSSVGNEHAFQHEIVPSSESSSSESSTSTGMSNKGFTESTMSGAASTLRPSMDQEKNSTQGLSSTLRPTMDQDRNSMQGPSTLAILNAPGDEICEVGTESGPAKDILEDYHGHLQPPTTVQSGSWSGSKKSISSRFKKNESKPHLEVNVTTEFDIAHDVDVDVPGSSAEKNLPAKKLRVHYPETPVIPNERRCPLVAGHHHLDSDV